MNYIGIDVSKYKHDCFIVTELGEVLNAGFTFANNASGFAQLLKTKTDKLDAKAIAEYLIAKDYKPHETSFYPMFALKQLTRLRSSLVTNRSRYLVELTKKNLSRSVFNG